MWVGRVHIPFSKRRVHEEDVLEALKLLRPGDVLLTAIRGEPTNFFIPGEFTHTAIWSPDGSYKPIVEATGPGCHDTGAYDFFLEHDRVVILRSKESNEFQTSSAAALSRRFIGLPYDIKLQLEDDAGLDGDKAVYCAEVAYTSHLRANPAMEFRARLQMGMMTVSPMDFLRATKYWGLVWDSDGRLPVDPAFG